ncbi:hypothetical protein WICMUC_005873 [Wickerhamomyces mucosus]|uniref:Uncharacterized protein n=1 Tax=Wickerhamomyces mucosus TaxID=1378264 RepID=A0A9P8T387_9ASCO|nr:hypothetical protein WICMUC_005873 [Wickerhamomyces mucosus]
MGQISTQLQTTSNQDYNNNNNNDDNNEKIILPSINHHIISQPISSSSLSNSINQFNQQNLDSSSSSLKSQPSNESNSSSTNIPSQQQQQQTSLRRGPWSSEEDRKLLDSINQFGPSNWVRISQSLGTRTPKQCRERYHQNLKPSLNRNPISPEEGLLIEELVQRYGKRWAEIARHLNGRSDNAIKNWWNGGANRRRRASSQAILETKNLDIQPFIQHDIINQQQQHLHPHQYPQQHYQLPPPQQFGLQHQLPLHQIPPQQVISQQLPPHLYHQPLQSTHDHNQQQQQPPNTSIKRFLEEQHLPKRRHSAQTILTTESTSSLPSSRNSLVSIDYSNNNSRRSSLAFDFNNNLRKNSINSINSNNSFLSSPNFSSQRNSIVGGLQNITPLSPMNNSISIHQQSNPSINFNQNLFKKDFNFNKINKENHQSVKLPGPTSIHSNQSFLQPSRIQSTLSQTHSDELYKEDGDDNNNINNKELSNSHIGDIPNPKQKNDENDENNPTSKKVMNISNLLE